MSENEAAKLLMELVAQTCHVPSWLGRTKELEIHQAMVYSWQTVRTGSPAAGA